MKHSKSVAIIQSSYIPWKGYFDIINRVDEFILYDDCQFTKRDWRNRNQIKTQSGALWLSIPVLTKGRYTQKIHETLVQDGKWARQHWQSIYHSYLNAPFFSKHRVFVEKLYMEAAEHQSLSEINHLFIRRVCELLGFKTKLTWSMDYQLEAEGPSERLLELCRKSGANLYLSGPSAKAYLDQDLFEKNGIGLSYIDYSGYPEYPQAHGPFIHQVSVLDMIFNVGAENAASMFRESAVRAQRVSIEDKNGFELAQTELECGLD